MAVAALAITYSGLVPFALLVGAVALIMCWEWGRVVRGQGVDGTFAIHAAASAAACYFATTGQMLAAVASVGAGAVALFAWSAGHRVMSAVGAAYVGLPVVALLWFRGSPLLGLEAIFFLFTVIWTTDIAAFAAGRSIGGPKLWPRVSPNKTWSGFVGGIAASAVAGGIFAQFVDGASTLSLAATAGFLALVAQLGDLAESAMKRNFGVKDTSSIIPGHGGVMDRADSTVAVSVAAAMLALLINAASPAVALFTGG